MKKTPIILALSAGLLAASSAFAVEPVRSTSTGVLRVDAVNGVPVDQSKVTYITAGQATQGTAASVDSREVPSTGVPRQAVTAATSTTTITRVEAPKPVAVSREVPSTGVPRQAVTAATSTTTVTRVEAPKPVAVQRPVVKTPVVTHTVTAPKAPPAYKPAPTLRPAPAIKLTPMPPIKLTPIAPTPKLTPVGPIKLQPMGPIKLTPVAPLLKPATPAKAPNVIR